jgi:hypothetical protein
VPGPPPTTPDAPPPGIAPPAGEAESPDAADEPTRRGLWQSYLHAPLANVADEWQENVSLTPSALLFGASGEEVSGRAKRKVEDAFADWIEGDDPDAPGTTAKVVVATVGKTAFDAAFDVFVTPALDPGSAVRGVMRFGAASGAATRDLEEGRTALGAAAIAGEAGSAILMVTGAKAMTGRILPRSAKVTLYTEKVLARDAHSVIEIQVDGQVHRSHVVATGSAETPAATAKSYAKAPDPAHYVASSRRISEPAARAMVREMTRAERAPGPPGEQTGYFGPYGALAEHCTTYTSAIAAEGGIVVVGRLGAHVALLSFALGPAAALLVGATATPAPAASGDR